MLNNKKTSVISKFRLTEAKISAAIMLFLISSGPIFIGVEMVRKSENAMIDVVAVMALLVMIGIVFAIVSNKIHTMFKR